MCFQVSGRYRTTSIIGLTARQQVEERHREEEEGRTTTPVIHHDLEVRGDASRQGLSMIYSLKSAVASISYEDFVNSAIARSARGVQKYQIAGKISSFVDVPKKPVNY